MVLMLPGLLNLNHMRDSDGEHHAVRDRKQPADGGKHAKTRDINSTKHHLACCPLAAVAKACSNIASWRCCT